MKRCALLMSLAWLPMVPALAALSAPDPTAQLDFWVGDWVCTWKGGEGTNTVTKVLDGKVIQEQFDGGESMPLEGISHSVWVPSEKLWKQTWVDNQGSYLEFTGGMRGDQFILWRVALFPENHSMEGTPFMQRMVFSEIKENSFVWTWESSRNFGGDWNVLWQINYQRKGTQPEGDEPVEGTPEEL